MHRTNINFYLCMYAAYEATGNGHADPGKIQQLDTSKLSQEMLSGCYDRVRKKYEKLADASKDAAGERDYDAVAKGATLLRELQVELRRRFNKK